MGYHERCATEQNTAGLSVHQNTRNGKSQKVNLEKDFKVQFFLVYTPKDEEHVSQKSWNYIEYIVVHLQSATSADEKLEGIFTNMINNRMLLCTVEQLQSSSMVSPLFF